MPQSAGFNVGIVHNWIGIVPVSYLTLMENGICNLLSFNASSVLEANTLNCDTEQMKLVSLHHEVERNNMSVAAPTAD